MKKNIFISFSLIITFALAGCGNQKKGTEAEVEPEKITTEESVSDQTVTIQPNDIVLNIDNVYNISGRGAAAEGVVLIDSIPVGTKIQIVGIDKPLIETEVKGIEIDRKMMDHGLANQKVGLILENVNLDLLKGYQRVVISKTKHENDLKPAKVYSDLQGTINENTYRNDIFGFTMHLSPSFTNEIDNQEGSKVSFGAPASFKDIDILRIYDKDANYRLKFTISNLKAITHKTATEELAYQYQQFKVTPVEKLLDDKQVSYVQIIHDDGKKMDVYAMIINNHYVTWQLNFVDENDPSKKELDAILQATYFDWARK